MLVIGLLSDFSILLDFLSSDMRTNPRNSLAQANALSLQSEAEMKLTPRNVAALHLYAELVGVSSQEFLNRFLVEFLIAHFGDPQIRAAEPFLGSFEFKDREKAERLANWIKERITVPTSRDRTEVEVLELSQGGFKVRAAWVGDMGPIC